MLLRFLYSLLVSVFACSNPLFAEQRVLKVGVIAPLTGPVASMGQSLEGAFRLIESSSISFAFQDDQCDAKKALSAYLLLASQGIKVFHVSCSGSILAIAPRARAAGHLLLSSYAGSIEIRELGSEVIRFNPDAVSDVSAMIDYLQRGGFLDGTKKVALFHEVQDYAVSFATMFRAKMGDRIGYIDDYRSADASFKTQILRLIGSGLSPIVFVPTSDVAARIILKEMRELGIKVPIIGEANLCDYQFTLKDFGLKGACFEVTFSGEKYEGFKSRYRERNNRESQYPFYDAITFDIGMVLHEFSKLQFSEDELVSKLRSYIMAGVAGEIASYAFEGHGEVKDGGQYLRVVEFK